MNIILFFIVMLNTKNCFYHQISSVMPTFIDNNNEDKLNLLMNKEHVNLFSRYICDIYKMVCLIFVLYYTKYILV